MNRSTIVDTATKLARTARSRRTRTPSIDTILRRLGRLPNTFDVSRAADLRLAKGLLEVLQQPGAAEVVAPLASEVESFARSIKRPGPAAERTHRAADRLSAAMKRSELGKQWLNADYGAEAWGELGHVPVAVYDAVALVDRALSGHSLEQIGVAAAALAVAKAVLRGEGVPLTRAEARNIRVCRRQYIVRPEAVAAMTEAFLAMDPGTVATKAAA